MSKKLWLLPLAVGMMAMSPLVVGQDQTKQQDQTRQQDREQVYGSQLMTQEERVAYRTRMRAAKTQEERERIRAEHHEQMKVRAKERGVTLPDQPPAMGGGMSPGGGMGSGGGGMGSGGGMGGGPRGR
ncbi:MAG: hypothetical protein Q8J61_04955 [Sulfuricella sp.]|nr:hypothetical protein [Sulfuricella sp.]